MKKFSFFWLISPSLILFIWLIIGSIDPVAAASPPEPPFAAWTIAPDGSVYVLDATGRLVEFSAVDLTPISEASPLFQPQPDQPIYLVAGDTQIIVSSETISQTYVLDRQTYNRLGQLDQTGPIAFDPQQNRLFLAAYLLPEPPTRNLSQAQILAYDLPDLSQPTAVLDDFACFSANQLHVEPTSRQLAVGVVHDCSSPPHRRHNFRMYDLDTLTELGITKQPELFGALSPLDWAEQARVSITVHLGMNDGTLFVYDDQGQTLIEYDLNVTAEQALIDSTGDWIYIRYERGLAALHRSDLSLQSFYPFTQTTVTDMALSPDDQTLYLLNETGLASLSTADLQARGVSPLSPFPATWLKDFWGDETPTPRFYPSPTIDDDEIAFVSVTRQVHRSIPYGGQIYRSDDGGRSWHPIPLLVTLTIGPDDRAPLSLSPTFNLDQTLVAGNQRSTDAGQTWSYWSPPMAFMTDRDGNRELYMTTPFEDDLRRLTDHPAADVNPAWSPAWTRLAFQSNRHGLWDIFSLSVNCDIPQMECDLQQLTDDPADDMLPAWSPDGRRIAFVSTRDGNPEIYVMDQDGQNQRRLTFYPGGDWRPAWLPDSQQLLFTSDRTGSNDIYRLTVPRDSRPLTAEPELTPVISNPADDRDPAVGLAETSTSTFFDFDSAPNDPLLYFLSDRDGEFKPYIFDLIQPQSEAVSLNLNAAHPAPRPNTNNLFVAVEQDGNSNIVSVSGRNTYSPTVVITSPSFDGQPAGGPVWWLPDLTESLAQLTDPAPNWSGVYTFTEVGQSLSSDPPQPVWEYKLTVYEDNGNLLADLAIDGFQTMTRLLAEAKVDGQKIEFYFKDYRPDNLFEPYQPGDLLFTLEEIEGQLLTTWGNLTPQFDPTKGVCKQFVRTQQ